MRSLPRCTQTAHLPAAIAHLWKEWGGLLGTECVIPRQESIGFVDDVRGPHFAQVKSVMGRSCV